jgi:AcrR family transcriptional regulator
VTSRDAPQRADAQRNRDRILQVALTELRGSADTPLSVIAKKAGVGQGTFYRNFPNREALVFEIYRHETQQLADHAAELLQARDPDQALREWMDRLAEYAMTKTGLAAAIRQVIGAPVSPANPAYPSIVAAVEPLLRANDKAGTIRPGVTADDFILAIAGLWHIDPRQDWQPQAARLLDLVMDGLRVGAPSVSG